MRNTPNVAGSRSDVGCVREHNEDSLIVQPPVYAVADGMGGHAAGEVASEIAIETLAENAPLICDSDALIDTVNKINKTIIDAAANGQGRPGMGTTLTAAILDGNQLLVAQVGDSRAYLLHRHSLQQLTKDHSYVGELLAGGHISEQEAAIHPKRSVITRALGSDPKTEADIYQVELAIGDRLLLCSDGLSGMVSDSDIESILSNKKDPQAATDELIEAARHGGGMDNITAIVVDVNTDESSFLQSGFNAEAHKRLGQKREGTGNDNSRNISNSGYSSNNASGQGRRSNDGAKRLHLGVITFVLLFVLLIAAAITGTWMYANNSVFLRAENGLVVVYRGLPGEILPGVSLQWVDHNTEINAADLDLLPDLAKRLEEGVQADSLNEAAALVASYEQQIADQKARKAKP